MPIKPIPPGGGGEPGATTFVELTDVPSTYSGQADKLVAVNGGATGLQFIPAYPTGTYTPVLTTTSGTLPQYVLNSGIYQVVGQVVHVSILFNGDGGNEGAGSGELSVSLPFNRDNSMDFFAFPCGFSYNPAVQMLLAYFPNSNRDKMPLYYNNAGTFTALTNVQQNGTSRSLNLQFWYKLASD